MWAHGNAVLGYVYWGAYHCVECVKHAFTEEEIVNGEDDSGDENITPIHDWDLKQDEYCDDCGKLLD